LGGKTERLGRVSAKSEDVRPIIIGNPLELAWIVGLWAAFVYVGLK
jgi:hypothetical protein